LGAMAMMLMGANKSEKDGKELPKKLRLFFTTTRLPT
jgi:hypothetical protein